jgi:RES domain-containing protein
VIPSLQEFNREGMHRLIPSEYSGGETVLKEISNDAAMLADILLLDGATDDGIKGEQRGLSGISNVELVYGIPNAQIIRAAFLHTNQFGSRFNDATRGAWYAAYRLETSLAEATYHKARNLAEMVVPELPQQRPGEQLSEYDDWLADFHLTFHVLDPAEEYSEYLLPEPVPFCYAASQQLARQLIDRQSNGILYPSVRHKGGSCLVCFRPPLVYNPRLDARYQIKLKLAGIVYESQVRKIAYQPIDGS